MVLICGTLSASSIVAHWMLYLYWFVIYWWGRISFHLLLWCSPTTGIMWGRSCRPSNKRNIWQQLETHLYCGLLKQLLSLLLAKMAEIDENAELNRILARNASHYDVLGNMIDCVVSCSSCIPRSKARVDNCRDTESVQDALASLSSRQIQRDSQRRRNTSISNYCRCSGNFERSFFSFFLRPYTERIIRIIGSIYWIFLFVVISI